VLWTAVLALIKSQGNLWRMVTEVCSAVTRTVAVHTHATSSSSQLTRPEDGQLPDLETEAVQLLDQNMASVRRGQCREDRK
jgi:hypothetical protein